MSKDHWNATAYSGSAGFVPLLAQRLVEWLRPVSSDTILDLGCGDGILTLSIAKSGAQMTALDSSRNLIEAAQANQDKQSNANIRVNWNVQDCRLLEEAIGKPPLAVNMFDKVFSNAALHWILRDADTRDSVLSAVFRLLVPGGLFVFEMGGAGNVAEVHTALVSAAITIGGLSSQETSAACPWFFPSEACMKGLLDTAGFEIEKMEVDYRPTQLPRPHDNGTGGIEGWVRLFGANFLDKIGTKGLREATVKHVCDVLRPIVTHADDNREWVGYVRLRGVARKPM